MPKPLSLELVRLYTKAMKQVPGSPAQQKTRAHIAKLLSDLENILNEQTGHGIEDDFERAGER